MCYHTEENRNHHPSWRAKSIGHAASRLDVLERNEPHWAPQVPLIFGTWYAKFIILISWTANCVKIVLPLLRCILLFDLRRSCSYLVWLLCLKVGLVVKLGSWNWWRIWSTSAPNWTTMTNRFVTVKFSGTSLGDNEKEEGVDPFVCIHKSKSACTHGLIAFSQCLLKCPFFTCWHLTFYLLSGSHCCKSALSL